MKSKRLNAHAGAVAGKKDIAGFLDKMKEAAKGRELDLSLDEDLSIGIMNLISIEEHLFFTANKTGKDSYYDLLNEVREIRKVLLKQIVVDYEGEVWCIGKHLLASSMRLMEVGTKVLNKKELSQAKPYFERSYRLFRMFWEIILQPQKLAAQEKNADLLKKNVTIFYEADCVHCKTLEAFLVRNDLYKMFNIIKKDVSAGPAHTEMEKVHKNCLKGAGELVVPLVYQDGKCAMGEEGSLRLFKSLMWDNVKEVKQRMEALLKEGVAPDQLKSHVENYNKTVDAALNCCKE